MLSGRQPWRAAEVSVRFGLEIGQAPVELAVVILDALLHCAADRFEENACFLEERRQPCSARVIQGLVVCTDCMNALRAAGSAGMMDCRRGFSWRGEVLSESELRLRREEREECGQLLGGSPVCRSGNGSWSGGKEGCVAQRVSNSSARQRLVTFYIHLFLARNSRHIY